MADIKICDICGSRDGVKRKCYVIGRSSDSAGSMDDDCVFYDLCANHQLAVLEQFIHELAIYKSMQFEIASKMVEIVNTRIEYNKNRK